MAVIVSKELKVPDFAPPIGTAWLYEVDGTFTAPANGIYQIEMHGGGGGGSTPYRWYDDDSLEYYYAAGSGGGSGEIYTTNLTKGTVIPVTVGKGGVADNVGGTTTFGTLFSLAGGGAGKVTKSSTNPKAYGGTASGSLATAGYSDVLCASNIWTRTGEGNKNNTAQTYGDGGRAGGPGVEAGKSGAVIVTFMGVT